MSNRYVIEEHREPRGTWYYFKVDGRTEFDSGSRKRVADYARGYCGYLPDIVRVS